MGVALLPVRLPVRYGSDGRLVEDGVTVMRYGIISCRGGREVNEDRAKAEEKDGNYCFVLCDGLGGHDQGEVAAELVSETILTAFRSQPQISGLEGMFELAQQRLQEEQEVQRKKLEMKTTAVVLLISGEHVRWAHIGDSRLYCFRKKLFRMQTERTIDHSVSQMMALKGEIKEREIRFHEDRGHLLRVMGMDWEVPKYELGGLKQRNYCQHYLLCSDGWWEWVDEKFMVESLKHSDSVYEWMSIMCHEIERKGGGKDMDNYSAIGIWV